MISGSPHILRSANAWYATPQHCVKVNVDAHVSIGNGVSFDVVIRDTNGKYLVAAVKKISADWMPNLAEAGAARYGWSRGCKKV